MNDENASSLCVKNKTHVNLEKSSTTTRPYFSPSRLVALVGPKRSRCNNSKGLDVDTTFFDLKVFLVCFPSWHALHILSSLKFICEIPTIRSFLIYLSIK